MWKYWTYDSRSGAAAVLRINQPGWWFGAGGAEWVSHIDLVHRITFERRLEGLFPHYEGVLVVGSYGIAGAVQSSDQCDLPTL